MYLQKVISKKTVQKLVFLLVSWEGHWRKQQDPDPHPDPLVRGMNPWIQIRIRIHPKMSWIRNTAFNHKILKVRSMRRKDPRKYVRLLGCWGNGVGQRRRNKNRVQRRSQIVLFNDPATCPNSFRPFRLSSHPPSLFPGTQPGINQFFCRLFDKNVYISFRIGGSDFKKCSRILIWCEKMGFLRSQIP